MGPVAGDTYGPFIFSFLLCLFRGCLETSVFSPRKNLSKQRRISFRTWPPHIHSSPNRTSISVTPSLRCLDHVLMLYGRAPAATGAKLTDQLLSFAATAVWVCGGCPSAPLAARTVTVISSPGVGAQPKIWAERGADWSTMWSPSVLDSSGLAPKHGGSDAGS